MLCSGFRCVNLVDDICQVDIDDNGCIGDLCENWGECINCQQQDDEKCDGIRR